MFGILSTSNLYICELRTVKSVNGLGYGVDKVELYVEKYYVIAKKIDDDNYMDIFTKSIYNNKTYGYYVGSTYVFRTTPIISSEVFITKKTALEMLNDLNYYHVKRLTRKKR